MSKSCSASAASCPKSDGYVGREDRAVYFAQLNAISEWVSITGAKCGCCGPDDDKLLEAALMGEVNCLITAEPGPFGDFLV